MTWRPPLTWSDVAHLVVMGIIVGSVYPVVGWLLSDEVVGWVLRAFWIWTPSP